MTVPVASVGGDSLGAYLEDCRSRVLTEIRGILPAKTRHGRQLYDLMLDYPLRPGKALRPALCIAVCRVLGGALEAVLPTATVLELYHNAFLIHDDVEDGSEKRRNADTLHRLHGVPIAVNVGDGMLALALEPLLDNMELLGLGRSLRILRTVARMARESAEGQMLELDWIRHAHWMPSDREYVRMVYKKSCWYTFVTPMAAGAIAAGAEDGALRRLSGFSIPLGVAFQIQDDVLNLVADEARYGKEIGGDLWEGKHTLLLLHALRHASPQERVEALRILRKGRRSSGAAADSGFRERGDVEFLSALIERAGSVAFAQAEARRRAERARRSFDALAREWPPSVHRDFLGDLVGFVVGRDR